MISSALALTLLAAPSPDAINRARMDFTECVREHMNKSIEDKIEPAVYDAALPTKCGAKEQAYRRSVIAADRAIGIRQADAEENANLVVGDIVDNARETFVYTAHGDEAPE